MSMETNMDIPKIVNITPPDIPPNRAVFLLSINGSREENTTIIINELEPK